MMDDKTNQNDHFVDGEIVGEFDDHTLMNLPAVPEDDQPPTPPVRSPAEQPSENPDRRQFIQRIVLGGVAALALGGSAAILTSRRRDAQTVVIPNGMDVNGNGVTDVAALFERIAELEYELAAVTADRDQLLSDLNSGDSAYSDLRAQLDALQAENDALQEINQLWLAMDELGLDSLIRAGLILASNALSALMTVVDLLRDGVEKGQEIIAEFLDRLPGPRDAIRWLQGRITRLSADLDWLASQVEEVVEQGQPLVAKIAEFVLWILDRLPFGAGDKVRAGLDAMETVIASLPDLITGVTDDVLDPLADWFSTDSDRNLSGILLDPISANLVDPARDTLTKASAFQTVFDEQLVNPVSSNLEKRATLRSQIEQAQASLMELRA